MSTENVSVLECGHRPFVLEREPGYGYRAYCPDCGSEGFGEALASNAINEFDKQVRKRRQAARKALEAAS